MEVLSSPSQGIIKSPNKYWVVLLFISSSAETLEFTFLPILFSHHPSSLPFKTICPLVPFLTGPIFFSVCCVTLDKLFNFSKPHLWLWLRISSVHSVVSNSLWPHGLQHTRLPCPSPTPGVYSNSCPIESVMPSNHLILCRPFLLSPSIFPSIRVFFNESALCIRWPKD